MAGQDDDGRIRPDAGDMLGNFDAVEVRQDQVEEDGLVAPALQQGKGLAAGGGDVDEIAVSFENGAEAGGEVVFVVDYQNRFAHDRCREVGKRRDEGFS